jgi:transposase
VVSRLAEPWVRAPDAEAVSFENGTERVAVAVEPPAVQWQQPHRLVRSELGPKLGRARVDAVQARAWTPKSARGSGARDVLKGVIWVLRSGAPWADLPKRFPPYQTCHRRFQQWQREGVLDKILRVLAEHFVAFCQLACIVVRLRKI